MLQKACLYNCFHWSKWKYLAQKLVAPRTWKLFRLSPFYSLSHWNFLLVIAVPSQLQSPKWRGTDCWLLGKDLQKQKKKSPLPLPKPIVFSTAAEMQNRRVEREPERRECVQVTPSSGCSWAALSHNKKSLDTRQTKGRTWQSKAQPPAHSYTAMTSSELRVVKKQPPSLNIKALLLVHELPWRNYSYKSPGSFLILL